MRRADLMNFSENEWTLFNKKTNKMIPPRPMQVDIINEILHAIDQGYSNIILEAGTGIGKSVCATTISNYFGSSYIVTMTNQLLQQYLNDFDYMVKQIKGRSNYTCNYGGNCEDCQVVTENQKMYENYLKALKDFRDHPDKYAKPEKPIKKKKCHHIEVEINIKGKEIERMVSDCPYVIELKKALESNQIITNYDFLHYAGNYAGILPERDLIIFDESHNFEKKVMQLVIRTLNRKVIYNDYNFDIFDAIVEKKMTLKEVKKSSYWIGVVNKIIDIIAQRKSAYIKSSYGGLDAFEMENALKDDENLKKFDKDLGRFDELVNILENEKWIIEMPTKKQILNDDTYLTKNKQAGLEVDFKPLTITDYTETLLHFGETRLFMTGTLGSKDMFCKWIGIDPDDTYYIYQKSPFPVENRPIIRDYAGCMSGLNRNVNPPIPNWKNEDALLKIYDILEEYPDSKGVIHVSSNDQAWWIVNELKKYTRRWFNVAYGKDREQKIKDFEDDTGNMVLVGAGIKDGIDLKDDKCRFQILFKMPFPNLGGAQVNIRKRYDPVWYIYQTVMPLMQAYGRGIRDVTDWCTMYVLDSDFDNLLQNYHYLFNEYFLEAVEGLVIEKPKRVKRVPRKQKIEAK